MSTFLVYGGIFGIVVLLVLRRPSVAMGAFLCTYSLEQWAQSRESFFYQNSWLTNVATVCLLLWALAIRRTKGIPIFSGGMPRIFWVIGALFLWSTGSLMWTIMPEDAWPNWQRAVPYLVATILIMPLLVRDKDDLKAAFQMAMLLGSVVLLLLLAFTDWEDRRIVLQQGAAIGSVKGKHGSPLATASLAGWISIIALLMNFRGLGRFWQLLRWPLILLALAVAFRSGSRGQLFAMCAAGIAFLPFSRRIKNIWGFVSMIVGVVMILTIATAIFDQFATGGSGRWNFDNMSRVWQGSRLGTSMILIRAWAEGGPLVWLIGLGTSASFDPNLIGFYPHLIMLEALGELGLIGFLILWMVPILTFYNFARLHALVKEDPVARGLAAAMTAMFLFEVILSFKQGSMLGSPFAFGFAVIVARMRDQAAREQAIPWLSHAQSWQPGDTVEYAPAFHPAYRQADLN